MHIDRRLAVLGLLGVGFCLLPQRAAAAEAGPGATPITDKNWQNHPLIKEIRSLVNQTDEAIKAKTLNDLTAAMGGWHAWGIDPGHVRKLRVVSKGDTETITYDHYYDPAEPLRFVFVQAQAANGTKVEYRIYFNSRVVRIWENRRETAGPGHPFPQTIPDEQLVLNPYALILGE